MHRRFLEVLGFDSGSPGDPQEQKCICNDGNSKSETTARSRQSTTKLAGAIGRA